MPRARGTSSSTSRMRGTLPPVIRLPAESRSESVSGTETHRPARPPRRSLGRRDRGPARDRCLDLRPRTLCRAGSHHALWKLSGVAHRERDAIRRDDCSRLIGRLAMLHGVADEIAERERHRGRRNSALTSGASTLPGRAGGLACDCFNEVSQRADPPGKLTALGIRPQVDGARLNDALESSNLLGHRKETILPRQQPCRRSACARPRFGASRRSPESGARASAAGARRRAPS